MADKQTKPVEKNFSFNENAEGEGNEKGKYIKTIYFSICFAIRTLLKYTF